MSACIYKKSLAEVGGGEINICKENLTVCSFCVSILSTASLSPELLLLILYQNQKSQLITLLKLKMSYALPM